MGLGFFQPGIDGRNWLAHILTSGRQELNEVTVVDFFHIGIFAFHVELDPLGSPDTHALGLQFRQLYAAAVEQEYIGIFLCHVVLIPEKGSCPLQGNAPGFFFGHVDHLVCDIIPHFGTKRKRKNC
jgi:hypothetical protein